IGYRPSLRRHLYKAYEQIQPFHCTRRRGNRSYAGSLQKRPVKNDLDQSNENSGTTFSEWFRCFMFSSRKRFRILHSPRTSSSASSTNPSTMNALSGTSNGARIPHSLASLKPNFG